MNIIVTPTQTIRVQEPLPKPKGIYWELLSPQKLAQVRVLQQLKRMVEEREGVKLPTGPDEELPPTAERRNKGKGKGGGTRSGGKSKGKGSPEAPAPEAPAPENPRRSRWGARGKSGKGKSKGQ